MSLKFENIMTLLEEHNLLLKNYDSGGYQEFHNLSYNSKLCGENTLFFCKGNFKLDYLKSAVDNGATCYISETEYNLNKDVSFFIVKNVYKAMSLLSAKFYNYPQNKLFLVGVTGTKGKTTTSYFIRGILNDMSHNRAALLSTVDSYLGPNVDDKFKSHLTTPESLDIFKYMSIAVKNGMKYFVMEVSSQAYKMFRVYGLKYNVGVFLNISPDHIGENEHKDFYDYLFCKKQILLNSDYCVLNVDIDHFNDVYYTAKSSCKLDHIYTFTNDKFETLPDNNFIDFKINNFRETLSGSEFGLTPLSLKSRVMDIGPKYVINIPGDYNESNATSAIITSMIAGATYNNIKNSLKEVKVIGRMEEIQTKNHGLIYIDYAHNYASLHALLNFLHSQRSVKRTIVVVGSTGNKGVSRREGFGKALSEGADIAILTSDDPGYEDPMKIAKTIDSYINHNRVKVLFELDRQKAIEKAINMGRPSDVIVLAGKGEDQYQKIGGVDTPYPNDLNVAKKILKGLKDE